MKVNFLRFIACTSLVVAMTVSTHSFAQSGIAPEELQSPAYSKDLVSAKWKAGNVEYTFSKDGKSIVAINGRECPGTWIMKNKTITINPRKLKWKKGDPCIKTRVLDVKSITATEMDIIEKEGNKPLHLIKQN